MRRTATDLEPFRVPAYRRYVGALTVMSISHWVYSTALSWTVLETTGSAAAVALIAVLMTLPLPFAAVPGGMLTDRIGPRNLVVAALLVEAVSIGLTGLLAASGALDLSLALLLVLVFGIADGLQVVPQQVLVGRIVPPHQMASAIGSSMITIGIGRILGGIAGGALVAGLGAQGALLPGALGIVVAALIVRSLPRIAGMGGGAQLRRSDLADGVRWLLATPGARGLVLLGAIAALFVWPYLGLLSVVIRDLVGGTPTDLGLLTAAGGVGAIIAALSMGVLGRRLGRGPLLVAVMAAAGALEIALGLSAALWPTLVVATLLAVMTVTHSATSNLVLQGVAPLRLRGRALALFGFAFFGCMPVGYLGAGIAADAVGVGPLLIGLGAATLLSTGLLAALDRRLLGLDIDASHVPLDEGAPLVVEPR